MRHRIDNKINPKLCACWTLRITRRMQQYSNTEKSAALRFPQDSASIINRPYFHSIGPHSTATVSSSSLLGRSTASTALFRERCGPWHQSVCSLSLSVADLAGGIIGHAAFVNRQFHAQLLVEGIQGGESFTSFSVGAAASAASPLTKPL